MRRSVFAMSASTLSRAFFGTTIIYSHQLRLLAVKAKLETYTGHKPSGTRLCTGSLSSANGAPMARWERWTVALFTLSMVAFGALAYWTLHHL
jgi:hypothetical protein